MGCKVGPDAGDTSIAAVDVQVVCVCAHTVARSPPLPVHIRAVFTSFILKLCF
jgi:hypothetical protein